MSATKSYYILSIFYSIFHSLEEVNYFEDSKRFTSTHTFEKYIFALKEAYMV